MAIRVEEIESRAGAVDLDRDRQLVLRFQAGDRAAFDDLYRRYHGRLLAYCTRRVGDRHAAEELAQEAFLRALRAMPRFAGERRFYPWMTVIAGRLCIDHHRRTARVETAPDIDTGVQEADHTELFAAVDRQLLDTALARLAPRHQEIIDLRERRGWSYNRIADHLQVPLTTVEALLHRARKALRREFLAVTAEHPEAAAPRRAHGFPLLVGLAGALDRIRVWAASVGPERLVPAAGAAAASVAAIGLAVGPIADHDAGSRPAAVETEATTASTSAAAPVQVDAGSLAPAPTTAGAPGAPGVTAAAPTPEVVVNLGAVTVLRGDAASSYADRANENADLRLDLSPVIDTGISPVPLVESLLGVDLPDLPELP